VSLSRKDYDAIARIIKGQTDSLDLYDPFDRAAVKAVRGTAVSLATYFAGQNERFDRVRFLKAAGVQG
jgi:hypothetical protein